MRRGRPRRAYERPGAVALAPGHGIGWVEFDPDADQPTADITLRPEQVIHGRLFDLQGQPVPNVTLSVAWIRRQIPPAQAGARSRFDGISYGANRVNDFPAWPRPMITNAEGRFTLRDLGRGLGAVLTVHHSRFALQRIQVEPDDTSESKSMSAALVPPQTITGRVTYADTGEGVPHAPLEVRSSEGRVALVSEFETDETGRFRINPPPADRVFGITAYPPEGQPYLIAQGRIDWPKGALEQSLDLALPRGVLIRGTVTEAGTGRPVPGASVAFIYEGQIRSGTNDSGRVETAADGTFQLAAQRRPGCLFVMGPSDHYAFQAVGSRTLENRQPRVGRLYAHANHWLDLKPGIESQEVHVVLRRGATVTGQVVGPDDRPVREAWTFSRVILDPRQRTSVGWTGRYHGLVRNGRFEIRGLDSDAEVPVYFLDPKGKLGGVVKLSGKSAAGGPVTVRLEPCGAARMRVVGPDGKPVVGRLTARPVQMVVTPGPPYTLAIDQAGLMVADEGDLTQIDTVNYPTVLVSDAQGRLTLPVLIPGATYRFIDHTTVRRGEAGPTVRKEFTVKPGATLDLGDLRIENPRSQ